VLLSRRHDWADRVAGSQFVRHYGAAFEGFVDGRQWFVLVDLGTEVVCGVLGALVGLPQQQLVMCATLKIAMVAVTVAYAIVIFVLRPSGLLIESAKLSGSVAVLAVAGSVAVLLSPALGPRFVLAQGIVAVFVFMSFRTFAVFVRFWRSPVALRVHRPPAPSYAALRSGKRNCRRFPRSGHDRNLMLALIVSAICKCSRCRVNGGAAASD
jgi:hypothetical protein